MSSSRITITGLFWGETAEGRVRFPHAADGRFTDQPLETSELEQDGHTNTCQWLRGRDLGGGGAHVLGGSISGGADPINESRQRRSDRAD